MRSTEEAGDVVLKGINIHILLYSLVLVCRSGDGVLNLLLPSGHNFPGFEAIEFPAVVLGSFS